MKDLRELPKEEKEEVKKQIEEMYIEGARLKERAKELCSCLISFYLTPISVLIIRGATFSQKAKRLRMQCNRGVKFSHCQHS